MSPASRLETLIGAAVIILGLTIDRENLGRRIQVEMGVMATTTWTVRERQVRDLIRLRTNGRIKQLHVTEKQDKILVWGYVSSAYLKQRAIQAIQEILLDFPFQAAIEVTVDLEDE
jgi:hypothetical protein